MIVILTIQCLFFADGGLLALGANVWNMAFYGCFVGYFLIYRPLMRSRCFARRGERAANRLKITLASVLGCVLTLQLGAFSVVLETTLSGITDLPFGAFCAIMQPIHLAIGLIEGLITAAVLLFLYEARPELLRDVRMSGETHRQGLVQGHDRGHRHRGGARRRRLVAVGQRQPRRAGVVAVRQQRRRLHAEHGPRRGQLRRAE